MHFVLIFYSSLLLSILMHIWFTYDISLIDTIKLSPLYKSADQMGICLSQWRARDGILSGIYSCRLGREMQCLTTQLPQYWRWWRDGDAPVEDANNLKIERFCCVTLWPSPLTMLTAVYVRKLCWLRTLITSKGFEMKLAMPHPITLAKHLDRTMPSDMLEEWRSILYCTLLFVLWDEKRQGHGPSHTSRRSTCTRENPTELFRR